MYKCGELNFRLEKWVMEKNWTSQSPIYSYRKWVCNASSPDIPLPDPPSREAGQWSERSMWVNFRWGKDQGEAGDDQEWEGKDQLKFSISSHIIQVKLTVNNSFILSSAKHIIERKHVRNALCIFSHHLFSLCALEGFPLPPVICAICFDENLPSSHYSANNSIYHDRNLTFPTCMAPSS